VDHFSDAVVKNAIVTNVFVSHRKSLILWRS
jgi:hypothetical protein